MKLHHEDIEASLRRFLQRHSSGVELAKDMRLVDSGFFHSLMAIQLIIFIEKEFGIELEDGDMGTARAHTIESLTRLIESKLVRRPTSTVC